MDEILTWNEVSDHSLWHLYAAIQHGADGGQPLFYTTAWLWAKAFGTGVLTLRLYSCVAMCGALLVVWHTIRRSYGLWATAFGVLTIWGTSGILLDQNAEARFYGLFMLMVAISVEVYIRVALRPVPTKLLLLAILLSQAGLVLTHVLGLIYSGLILFALIAFDLVNQRMRWKVYLSFAAGWSFLLVWVPAMRASMAAGKPHGWIPLPRLGATVASYFFEDYAEWVALVQRHSNGWLSGLAGFAAHLAILVPLLFVLLWVIKSLIDPNRWDWIRKHPLLLVSFALLAAPIILYLLSHLVTPVFLPRYILPSAIGEAIAMAAFADKVGADAGKRLRWFWIGLSALLVVSPVGSALVLRPPQVDARYLDVQRLDSIVPRDVSLVAGWQNDFEVMMRFSRYPQQRVYLLDWPTALIGPKELVLVYHLMQAYRGAGWYGQSIQDRDAFFCSHDNFWVLDPHFYGARSGEPSWFDLTVGQMPQFEWKIVETVKDTDYERNLIAVHRKTPLPFCSEK
jgi:hypothetical protein